MKKFEKMSTFQGGDSREKRSREEEEADVGRKKARAVEGAKEDRRLYKEFSSFVDDLENMDEYESACESPAVDEFFGSRFAGAEGAEVKWYYLEIYYGKIIHPWSTDDWDLLWGSGWCEPYEDVVRSRRFPREIEALEFLKDGSVYSHGVLHPPPFAVRNYRESRKGLDYRTENSGESARRLFCDVVWHNINLHDKGALTEAEVRHLREYARVLASGTGDEEADIEGGYDPWVQYMEEMAEVAGRLKSARERREEAEEEEREVFERMKKSLDEGHMSMVDFNTFLAGQRMERLERKEAVKIEQRVEIQDGRWRVGRRVNAGVTMWQDLGRAPTEMEKATAWWERELRLNERALVRRAKNMRE